MGRMASRKKTYSVNPGIMDLLIMYHTIILFSIICDIDRDLKHRDEVDLRYPSESWAEHGSARCKEESGCGYTKAMSTDDTRSTGNIQSALSVSRLKFFFEKRKLSDNLVI